MALPMDASNSRQPVPISFQSSSITSIWPLIKNNNLGTLFFFFYCTVTHKQKEKDFSNFPRAEAALSLVLPVWLGLVSSCNVSLWCCNLKDGGPFDPSPGFVGYRVFVNRKHSHTSRGEKLKHALLPLWPLNPCHLHQTRAWERRLN